MSSCFFSSRDNILISLIFVFKNLFSTALPKEPVPPVIIILLFENTSSPPYLNIFITLRDLPPMAAAQNAVVLTFTELFSEVQIHSCYHPYTVISHKSAHTDPESCRIQNTLSIFRIEHSQLHYH